MQPNDIYLCFDIGATSTKFIYWNISNGQIYNRDVFLTKRVGALFDRQFLVSQVLDAIKNCLNECQQNNFHLKGIGIASAGGINPIKQEVIFTNPTMNGYTGTNWKQLLSHFNVKTVVLNDVKAAGICEFADKQVKSGVMVTLGTGFGASFFIDGNLYSGANYMAGEIGQMVWPFDNSLILDTACSAVVATNKISKLINDPNFKLTEAEKIVSNPQAQDIKKEWTMNVATALKFIDYFFDPELFIVGGGVSKHQELILEIINQLPPTFKPVNLAQFGNDAAFYGLINCLDRI